LIDKKITEHAIGLVGKYLVTIGLLQIPTKDKAINVLKGNSIYKKKTLQKYMIMGGAGLMGSGIRRDYTIKYFKDPAELVDRLSVVMASIDAGNSSLASRNECAEILQHLLVSQVISKSEYSQLMKKI